MIIIEKTLGNAVDPVWADRLRDAHVDLLHLDQWEAQKSRLRKTTESGVELALSLDRTTHLHDADILAWDAEKNVAIVARIALNDVMVIDLGSLSHAENATVIRTMFELGHALGNQHWPAIIKDGRVYVPLTVARAVMSSVMKTHAFPGIRYEFAAADEVLPYMAPHEARRLFGGASQESHAHPPTGAHHHGHDHAHTDGRSNAAGQDHTHYGHTHDGTSAPKAWAR